MSKPKFTEGEWVAVSQGFTVWSDHTEDMVATEFNNEHDAHLTDAAPEMFRFLDDLANGRGTDYPIEQLLAKARGE